MFEYNHTDNYVRGLATQFTEWPNQKDTDTPDLEWAPLNANLLYSTNVSINFISCYAYFYQIRANELIKNPFTPCSRLFQLIVTLVCVRRPLQFSSRHIYADDTSPRIVNAQNKT